ncbi:MAG TPA: DUF1641 domain-containing protein [Paraburkholderia sp.]|jgi:uncharacterized protein YjgD (DUF1641 family)|nr:DUF1641 domain-containing protein [Paraburkholderia sp.]
MAKRIQYEPDPPKIGPDAHDELDRLLQTLHENGVLRLANDFFGAKTQIAQVVVDGLNKEGTLNAIQNLSVLLMAMSRIPPADFYKLVFAMTNGMRRASAWKPDGDGDAAPGVSGAYRMLHDETLWHALMPLIEGMKAFAAALDEDVGKPISAFSGKASAA